MERYPKNKTKDIDIATLAATGGERGGEVVKKNCFELLMCPETLADKHDFAWLHPSDTTMNVEQETCVCYHPSLHGSALKRVTPEREPPRPHWMPLSFGDNNDIIIRDRG